MTPEELKQWRERLGWTQPQAAAALGVSRRAYQYYEDHTTSGGRRRDTLPTLIELATAELARRHRGISYFDLVSAELKARREH